MITLDQAKQLKHGDILVHISNKNANGFPQKWKVNGKVKTWKRNPQRVKVPIRYGLYTNDYLTEENLHLLTLKEK